MSAEEPPARFTCTICRGTFDAPPGDEAHALAVAAQRFPGEPVEDMDPVCSRCWQQLKVWAVANGLLPPDGI